MQTTGRGALDLDLEKQQCYINGRQVHLTPLEYKLCALLVKEAGAFQSRAELLEKIWGIRYETGTNFLEVHVHALRKKLKNAGCTQAIATIRGKGYRMQLPEVIKSG